MEKLLTTALVLGSTVTAFAAEDLTLNQALLKTTSSKAKALKQNISFSYGIKYLGPSLSDNYENGATYNRFNAGQDWQGSENDPVGSTQLYHAFSLGYQITENIKLSYSATFQEDLNKNIKYETYNKDGSIYKVFKRKHGVSHNNHRLNMFVTNMYSNNYFFLMSNFYYEMPTTDSSKEKDMTYGLGIQPVIGIYSNITGLYHGLKISLERDYYKRQEYLYSCGGFTCTTAHQTFRSSITGYIGYNISDKTNWNMEIIYDWDQDGDQVDNNTIYNDNMDNVIEVGPNYKYSKNIMFGGRLQYAISKPSLKKSALIGTLNLSI